MEEIAAFEEYLREIEHLRMQELASRFPEERSISIDYKRLEQFNPELADLLLQHPDDMVKAAEAGLENLRIPAAGGRLLKAHCRFHRLPEHTNIMVQDLGAQHLDRLIKVEGIVSLSTEIKPVIKIANWECMHCGEVTKTYPEKNNLRTPDFCKCGRRDFRHLEKEDTFVNMQSAQMQDLVEKLRGNAPTSHITLWLEDDLVNQVSPGEKFTVTGILRKRPVKKDGKLSAVYEKMLEVNHLERMEKEFEALEISEEETRELLELSKKPDLFELLVKSIAPSIYGHEEVKLAIALQLFGGNFGKVLPDGKRIRGEIHELLIGDPGCLIADERVVLGNGAIMKIGQMGSIHLENIDVPLLTGQGHLADRAKVFHIYKNQPILEIVTESGKCIKGTFNHPLLVVEGMSKSWKRLDKLRIGDRLATVTGIHCTIKELASLSWKKSDRKYGPKFKGKLPSVLDVRLAGLLGYIQGDGWVNRTIVGMDIAPSEADLAPQLSDSIMNIFGISPITRIRIRSDRKPITEMIIQSTDIAGNLAFLNEKRIPDFILQSRNDVAAEYLAWLFEADGTVFSKGRGKRAIQLRTSPERVEFLRDAQILLLRFGIHSRILANQTLAIRRADSIKKYADKIGFRSRKKKEKLTQLVKDTAHLHHKLGRSRSERIISIRPAGFADVYDVEIPKGHRFIANGVVSHNTSKTTLLMYIKNLAPKCIYVSGKGTSGVGLCVAPDSLVIQNDKGMDHINQIVKRNWDEKTACSEGGGAFSSVCNGLRIVAADEQLNLEFKTAPKVWKINAPSLLSKIKTRRGKELVTTRETPILTASPNGTEWKKACDLMAGDLIASSRMLPTLKGKPIRSISLVNNPNAFVSEDISDQIAAATDNLSIEKGILLQQIAEMLGVSRERLYRWRNRKFHQGIPLAALKKLEAICCTKFRFNKLSVRDGKKCILPDTLGESAFVLAGLIAADGDIDRRNGSASIRFHNADKKLLNKAEQIAKEFGISARILDDGKRVRAVRFSSIIMAEILDKMGVPSGEKSNLIDIPDFVSASEHICQYLSAYFSCDGYVADAENGSPSVGASTVSERFARKLQLILEQQGIICKLRRRSVKGKKPGYVGGMAIISKQDQFYIEIRGLENLKAFSEKIGFISERKQKELEKIIASIKTRHENLDLLPRATELFRKIRKTHRLTAKQIPWEYLAGKRRPKREKMTRILRLLQPESEEARKLRQLCNPSIYWDEVVEAATIENESIPFVYDFTVDSHAFLANGIVVHNTASAEKDEFGEGWVLKAGAMVLASGGQVNIDEVDKMDENDRVAMHEALESGQISIAKAGIVTTFKARTAVLAAANPKLGRFNPNEPPAAQFDLSPTLQSRFDLIFPIKDVLDESRDRKLAEHILIGHRYASKAPEEASEAIVPPITAELLRKYIAYARKNFSPTLSMTASEKIKEFYLRLRKLGEKQNNFPVTARQIEGLIRLSEASAKSRLSSIVELQDADRAIGLTEFVLQTVFMDRETGRIDSDIINIGQAKSRTDRARTVLSIIQEREKTIDMVSVEDVVKEAEKVGIDEPSARRIIEDLHRQTEIYRPKSGFVRTSRKTRE